MTGNKKMRVELGPHYLTNQPLKCFFFHFPFQWPSHYNNFDFTKFGGLNAQMKKYFIRKHNIGFIILEAELVPWQL